jgi:hypothetical protein
MEFQSQLVMIESIVLFAGIELVPNLRKEHTVKYLKRYLLIDDLGDTIYVKKPGNAHTTYAIDFDAEIIICKIRKIRDESNQEISEIIFDSDDLSRDI